MNDSTTQKLNDELLEIDGPETEVDRSELRVSPSIFYPTLNSTARRIVHQGGQWSGKTVNILIVLAVWARNPELCKFPSGDTLKRTKLTITVTGESLPHLKRGALKDFLGLIYPFFKPAISKYNIAENKFTFSNGSEIQFVSFDNEKKARGAKRDILYVNEGNTFEYETFRQLDSRSAKTIVDYNPSEKFWAHDKVIGKKGNELYISDHRHNPFLSLDKHIEIESIKDPDVFRVYGRGMTGNVAGIIFPSWQRIPDDKFDEIVKDEPFWGGLDFGYNIDPTALVKIWRIKNNIYVKELAYSPDVTDLEIKQITSSNGFNRRTPVYCDHDKDRHASLRRLVVNAIKARKGKGSINAGILKVKEFNVFYNESSTKIHFERQRYVWGKDKAGNTTNEPVDQYNHLMDAIRYGVYSHFFRARGGKE